MKSQQKNYLINRYNELRKQEEDLISSLSAASEDLATAQELEGIERGRLLLAEAKTKDLRSDIERLENVILNDAPSRLAASRAVSHRREREAREAHLYAEIRRDRRERVLLEELFRLQKEAEDLLHGEISSLQQAASSQDLVQQRELIRDEILCLRHCLVLEGGVSGRQGLDRIREAIRSAQDIASKEASLQEKELVNLKDECSALEKRADRFRRERDDLLATLQSVSGAPPWLLRDIESRINTSPQKYTQSNVFNSIGDGFSVSPSLINGNSYQNATNAESTGALAPSADWIHDALAAVRRGKSKANSFTSAATIDQQINQSIPTTTFSSSSSSMSLNTTTRGTSAGSRARALVARRILGRSASARTSNSPGKDRFILFSHHTNSSRARTKTPPHLSSRISSPTLSNTRRTSLPQGLAESRPASYSTNIPPADVEFDESYQNYSPEINSRPDEGSSKVENKGMNEVDEEEEDEEEIPTPARQLAKDITSRAVTPHTARLIAAALAGVESPTSASGRQSKSSITLETLSKSPVTRPGSFENNEISNMIHAAEKEILHQKQNEAPPLQETKMPLSPQAPINAQLRGFDSALWQSVFPTSTALSAALSSSSQQQYQIPKPPPAQGSQMNKTPVLFAPSIHSTSESQTSTRSINPTRGPRKQELEKVRESAWGRKQGQKMLEAAAPPPPLPRNQSKQRAPSRGQQQYQQQVQPPRYQRRSQSQQQQRQELQHQQPQLLIPTTTNEARRILQELLQEHANDSQIPTSRSVSFADDMRVNSQSLSPSRSSHSPARTRSPRHNSSTVNLPRVTTPPGKRYAFGSLVNISTESYPDPLARPSGVESGQRRSPKKNLDEIPPSWTERLSRPRVVSPPRVQASESPILKVHNEFLSTMRSGSMNVSPRGNSNRQRFEVEKSPFVADVVAFKSSPNGKPPLTIREFFQRSGAVSTRDDHVTPDTINNRPPPGAEELFESALVKAIETAMNKHKGT
jgi:hypothetical protein